MSMTCPHCGTSLPAAGVAFCSKCRQALDEPPDTPRAPAQVQAERTATTTTALWYLGWLALIAGAGSAVAPARMRGLAEDAVTVTLVVAGAGLLGASYWLARRTKAASQRDGSGSPTPED
jgi:hypothetical protein